MNNVLKNVLFGLGSAIIGGGATYGSMKLAEHIRNTHDDDDEEDEKPKADEKPEPKPQDNTNNEDKKPDEGTVPPEE